MAYQDSYSLSPTPDNRQYQHPSTVIWEGNNPGILRIKHCHMTGWKLYERNTVGSALVIAF